jgi:hypothetical protein
VGLQLSNPQLEKKGNTTERYVGSSRIYNLGINTLAQVPLTAFGEHIVRHGILPINDPDTYYESVVTANNFQSPDSKDNRLLKYTDKFSLGGFSDTIRNPYIGSWNSDTELNKYVGGPGSTYGIGNTLLLRYTNTNEKNKIKDARLRSNTYAGKVVNEDGDVEELKILKEFLGASNQSGSTLAPAYGTLPNVIDNPLKNRIYSPDDKVSDYSGDITTPIISRITKDTAKITSTIDYGVSNRSESLFSDKEFTTLPTLINENAPLAFYYARSSDKPQPFAGKSRETTDELKVRDNFDFKISTFTTSSLNGGKEFDLRTGVNALDSNPSLYYFPASNNDTGSHDRKSGLPDIKNANDLVKDGPSTYPFVDNTDLTQLDLQQTAYNFVNPNLKTYIDISTAITKQTSKGTPLSHTNTGGAGKYIYNASTELAFNRENDRQVDKDALAIRFKPIDPFTGGELSTLSFLAYLKDYKDNFNSTWGDVKYVGRAEKFYIFNEFKRDISFSFTIPCFNKGELAAKHAELNKLVSITAGKYQGGLLGGIITKITLGNYINNQPGIITSIGFNPVDQSSWDLDSKLAFYIDVSVSFTLIHDFLPEYDKPFITISGVNNTTINNNNATVNNNPPPKRKKAEIIIPATISETDFGPTSEFYVDPAKPYKADGSLNYVNKPGYEP